MRNYELTVIFHPDLEMNIEPAVAKLKKILDDNGGKIAHEEIDGKKHLAYPIKKQEFGVFYFYKVALPTQSPAKINKTLNISDEVIRSLLVSEDQRKLKYEAKQAARQPHNEDNEEEEEK